LPDYLPRVRIEHALPESEKTCACGCGLTRIGEDTSEQLDIVPAQVRVLRGDDQDRAGTGSTHPEK
jgi:transposase